MSRCALYGEISAAKGVYTLGNIFYSHMAAPVIGFQAQVEAYAVVMNGDNDVSTDSLGSYGDGAAVFTAAYSVADGVLHHGLNGQTGQGKVITTNVINNGEVITETGLLYRKVCLRVLQLFRERAQDACFPDCSG